MDWSILLYVDWFMLTYVDLYWFMLISWSPKSVQTQWFTAYVFVRIVVPSFGFGSHFGVRWNRNGAKGEPKDNQTASTNHDRKKVPQSAHPGYFFIFFWFHLADWGCHVGGHWILKGSPNRPFLYTININHQKIATMSGASKNMELWWKVNAKRRCPEMKQMVFPSYMRCCNLRGRGGRELLLKMGLQNTSQIYPKWAPSGRHFEI